MFEEPPSFSNAHTQQVSQQAPQQVPFEVQQHFRQAESFRAAYSAAPQSVVTIALIAINVLIFTLMVIKGVPFMEPTAGDVLPVGANFGPYTLNGEWWRLITGCFLHFGVIHIAMNMIVLYQVGIFTEKLYGNVRFLVMYLLSGVGGNLVGLYIHPNTVSAGASGAVFGVYGALLAYLVVQRGVVPTASAMSIAKSSGIFLAINLVYGPAKRQHRYDGAYRRFHYGHLCRSIACSPDLRFRPAYLPPAHCRRDPHRLRTVGHGASRARIEQQPGASCFLSGALRSQRQGGQ